MKLNERHKRFVELYKLSNRGWYAAIDCYKKVFVNCNNDKSASASAYKILSLKEVKEYLCEFDNAEQKRRDAEALKQYNDRTKSDIEKVSNKILSREKGLANLSDLAQLYINNIAEEYKKYKTINHNNVIMYDRLVNTIAKIDGWQKTQITANIQGVSDIIIKKKDDSR
nr:hypothetical protein [uncultured Flavobacterium sp.]